MGATVVLVVLAVVAAFYVGAFLYLGVTFAMMRGHTEPRSLRASARSFWFELVCVVIVQPLLPFFYFVGRRMGDGSSSSSKDRVPIVFVHGYFQNRVDFVFLARELAKAGLGPFFGFNYPFLSSVRDNARRLADFCEEVRAETGAAQVDLVSHSLGGLVSLELVRQDPTHVRRCVTVASPHAGVVFRGPILGASGRDLRKGSELLRAHEAARAGVPVLSVFSSHDNVVHPKVTSALAARGGEDVEVAHFGHFGILFSRTVARHIAAFLKPAGAVESGEIRVEAESRPDVKPVELPSDERGEHEAEREDEREAEGGERGAEDPASDRVSGSKQPL